MSLNKLCPSVFAAKSFAVVSCVALAISVFAVPSPADPPVLPDPITVEDLVLLGYDYFCPPGCDCTMPTHSTGPCTSGKVLCDGQTEENCTGGHIINQGWSTGCKDAIYTVEVAEGIYEEYFVFVNCAEVSRQCWQTVSCIYDGGCKNDPDALPGPWHSENDKYPAPCFISEEPSGDPIGGMQ